MFGVLVVCLLAGHFGFAQEANLKIGDKLEGFTLPDASSGETVSLADFKDSEAVVLMFIATGCPYSNAFNKVMADLADRYGPKGVTFVGINSNKTEPTPKVKQHAADNGFGFPVLKDDANKFADQLGAQVTPEVFLLDDDAKLRYHGAIGNSRNPTTKAAEANGDELVAALEAVLAGRDPALAETKMFGCTIKRVD
jgi:peroxiredoxin